MLKNWPPQADFWPQAKILIENPESPKDWSHLAFQKTQNVKIDDQTLQYNTYPKLLGVNLDENISFKKHIEVTAQKASKGLGILREIKGIAKVYSKNLIQLYTSHVWPVIDYHCRETRSVVPTICVLRHQLVFCFRKNISPADSKILIIDMFRWTEGCDKYAIIGGFKYDLRRCCCFKVYFCSFWDHLWNYTEK